MPPPTYITFLEGNRLKNWFKIEALVRAPDRLVLRARRVPGVGCGPSVGCEAEEAAGPSQHLVKGKIGELKDTYLRGSVENQSDRTIYPIINESADVKPISPGQTLDAYADGVVDLQNKVVYKMGERSDVLFTAGYEFKLLRGLRQSLYAELKKIGLGNPDPYGPYDGEIQDGSLLFIHRENGYISPAMKQWYELAKQKESQ